MANQGLPFLGLFAHLLVVCLAQDYCSISQRHTLCLHGAGPARRCSQLGIRGLSQDEKQGLTDYHNRLRSQVASGKTDQPPARDMRELVWDPELARIAQALADECKFRHDCSDCRRVQRFRVGQNIFQSFSRDADAELDWKAAVDSWYEEISSFPPNGVERFQFSTRTGHYSQIAWGSTSRLGCGVTGYASRGFRARLLVCNYGEAGNLSGGKMYTPGRACSSCPSSTSCSSTFPGLCSEEGGNEVSPPRPTTPPRPPPTSSRPTNRPKPITPTTALSFPHFAGQLSSKGHGVKGDVILLSDTRLLIHRFWYDGATAGITFIAGTSSKRSPPSGVTLTVAEKYSTEKQEGSTFFLDLPRGVASKDLAWFAVWCWQCGRRGASLAEVAISPASAQGSAPGFGFGSGRPNLAGLLQGLLQDEGGQPAVEAVVAEEEDYEEEYGEEGEEQDAEGGEVEEECQSWREGQGVPGETVGRVCLDGPDPVVGESKPPVAASTVEEDLEEANQEDGEVDAANELEDAVTEVSCVEEGKANLGHNLMVQHGVPTPRLCALVCQTQPLCRYWNHLASQAPFPWDSKCYLKVVESHHSVLLPGYTGGVKGCLPVL